ncbi:MAG: DNA repair protein RadA, partial [Alphaproteobacteria bacterium]|nr:DNA repair protein RadA [Alphaproteobacteria bacterium]
PLLVEIQALVSQSGGMSPPRRAVVGWDNNRLSMILAVLEARCGLAFGNKDVFLNVAGGLKLTEPAADLAVTAAIISALTGKPVPADCVCFGEIGLSGEVRSVAQPDLRMKEAVKLGFAKALVPPAKESQKTVAKSVQIAVKDIGNVKSLSAMFVGNQG